MTQNGKLLEIRGVWKPPKTATMIAFTPQHGIQAVVVVGNLGEIKAKVEASILGSERFVEFQGANAGNVIWLARFVLETASSMNICEFFEPMPEMRMPDGQVRPAIPAHYQPV
jgi:hypothetical protein